MAEDNKTLTVSIAGKDYQVACPAGEEDSLREAAQYLHNLMESIRSSGRVVGLDRVAVMAALNISNELLQSKQQHDAEQAKVVTTVQKLSDRVADAVSANKQLQL
mgnify:FL=1